MVNNINRRALLKATAAAAVYEAFAPAASGLTGTKIASAQTNRIITYLERHVRPDGGYGWDDQPSSHPAPTHAVIGCYHLLRREIPDAKRLADFVLTHRIVRKFARADRYAADMRSALYQQLQSLIWLDRDVMPYADEVRGWVKPSGYSKAYELNGQPILQQEAMAFACRKLLDMSVDSDGGVSSELTDYVLARRRPNGSFNNTPAADGSDGHVVNTWWGLVALDELKRLHEQQAETVRWLGTCQLSNGGFTYQPKASVGGIDDVQYTRAAVRSLALLSATAFVRQSAARYLLSLWNEDGGFGDRPGLPSRPEATYLALDALQSLDALVALNTASPKPVRRRASRALSLPANLKPFTIQLEAHGQGSPAEAVELARSLRIHLWGAKNAQPAWIAHAQKVADRERVPVRFFTSNEEYGTYIGLPGLGTYSHMSDIIAPADAGFGKSLAKREPPPSWSDFRAQRLAPLHKAQGRLVWQICDNDELTRILLDDSVGRGGYAAISAFHHDTNFITDQPHLWRYRHELPFVSLQDAHGSEPWWWADQLAGYRTIFLANEPTWAAWLTALERGWVVAVRHDARTAYRTEMFGGTSGVQEFVKRRENGWKWWLDKPEEIDRPLASIVAVKPDDVFEEGRPAKGVTIRVRRWWAANTQGRPLKPVVELVSLSLNGKPVEPRYLEKKDQQDRLVDCFHQLHFDDLPPGRYTIEAVVRNTKSNKEFSLQTSFVLG